MSSKTVTSQTDKNGSGAPRAIIHKQILEAAESRPDGTIQGIAEEVDGASLDLVERVLNEYGDPAASTGAVDEPSPNQSGELTDPTATTDGSPRPTLDELTEKQRELVTAIYDHPDATQRELADHLDVSGATISFHAQAIDGLEWDNRREFANRLLTDATMNSEHSDSRSNEQDRTVDTGNGATKNQEDDATETGRSALKARVDRLEERLDGPNESRDIDPELAHKIIQACMKSEQITAEEELEIISTTLDNGSP